MLRRRQELEIFLEKLKGYPDPKLVFEQYATPARVVANVVWEMVSRGDLPCYSVVDLGCGTGRFSIACALMGAEKVLGVDVDRDAVCLADENSKIAGVERKVKWVVGDIDTVGGSFDLAVMNPPFGIKGVEKDRRFVLKGLDLAPVVYSLHLAGEKTRKFLNGLVNSYNAVVTEILRMEFEIPKTYKFHRKKWHVINVDMFRIQRIETLKNI